MGAMRADHLTVQCHAPFRLLPLGGQDCGGALVRAVRLLEGLPAHVSDGTALGLHRDGDVIADDTDLDFAIMSEPDQARIDMPGMELIRTVDWEGRPIQTAYMDPPSGVVVDLYYYYADLIPGRRVAHCEGGTISNPDLPIGMLPTIYGDLPFPLPVERYLEERFGEGWRTPQRGKKGVYA